jgi:VWFA-related protein
VIAVVLSSYGHPSAQRLESPGDRSIFQSGVDLVTLHVTVTDRSRRYVTDLERDQFRVFENGRRQELKFFQKSGLPLALTLLLDTSASMENALPIVQEAAVRLVRQLEPQDVASVIAFDQGIHVLQGFTNDPAVLESAIRRIEHGGTTSFYTAVYVALKEFAATRPVPRTSAPRRRTVVVLSDGVDSSSLIGFEEVLELATRTDAAIYAVCLGTRNADPRQHDPSEFVLRRLSEQTGGRAFFPLHGYELPNVYAEIERELSSQYVLAYEPSEQPADGRFRNLAVLVDFAGAVARTRKGYFARDK